MDYLSFVELQTQRVSILQQIARLATFVPAIWLSATENVAGHRVIVSVPVR